MEKFKNHFSTYMMLVLVFFISSCDDDLTEYPTIAYQQCEEDNIVQNPDIITDFECQSNQILSNVEAIRNPSEIGINKSKFIGEFTDGAGAWDALIIDYGAKIDLSTNALFKIKIKTVVEGKLIVKLEGGTSMAVENEVDIAGDNYWVEYQFNFGNQAAENHTKIVLFFKAGVENDGTDLYYLDDLFFDTSIDPCQGVSEDLSIVNDFDCQKNYEIPEVTKVLNPGKSAMNDSDFVGKYIDEAGAWDAVIIDFESQIDLSIKNVFKIKVNAPVNGILKVKLEGGSSAGIEKDAEIATIGEWVEYSFDFSSQASENHTKMVLFFNAGIDTDGVSDNYFIDDLKFEELADPCVGAVTDLFILNDFDCQQNTTIPGFISNTIIDNPDKSGVNISNSVLEITDDGTNAWDALLLDFNGPMDLSTKNYLKIKVLSTRAVPLLAKLEGGSSAAKEVWGTIDVVNEWTEYVFDFSDQANENHNKVVLFFNGGQADGTSTDVYYIDDIKFGEYDPCDGIATDVSIVNDFECQQNYAITCCIDSAIMDNPLMSGINMSDTVLEVTDNGEDAWDALVFDFGQGIDLSTKNQLKIKILSSRAAPLLVKLEGGSSGASEVWGVIDTVDEWTEYTFDFSSQAAENHQKIVLFFNGGASDGTDSDIYFIDDLKWE